MRNIRRSALEKLATLSATSPAPDSSSTDFKRLYRLCPPHAQANGGHDELDGARGGAARVPMSLPELETLLALCKAAPQVVDVATAEQLLNQLTPYLPESFAQAIAPSPFLRDLDPSPWEILTHNLAFAILSLGNNHEGLKEVAAAAVKKYVAEWSASARSLTGEHMSREDAVDNTADGDVGRVLCLAMSMLGFLSAASACASIWNPAEMLDLIENLRTALSEKLMISVEASVSNVLYGSNSKRTLREWRRHAKHYAAMGRPLGALLLHHGLMQVVVACTATVASPSERESGKPVLDRLQSAHALQQPLDAGAETLLASVAGIAEEELERINADSEYVKRVGTVWQQHIAHAVLADALVTYLCCAVLNEEIADSDKLMDLLESTLSDDILAADEILACVVLKSMSILGKSSPDHASHLSKSLPRIIVQGGLKEGTSAVAADCLASVLMHLPQDAVITTLYSLGNVLSGKQAPERANTGLSQLNGGAKANGTLHTQHQTGSTISLAPADVDEPSHVYGTVIQTIVGVACRCKDQKISELALSMLVQKIGRVSISVDAKIIIESSLLGAHSGPGELRALLKLYSKLARDAIVQDNSVLLDAVMRGRCHLSREFKVGQPLFEVYLQYVLDDIVSKGDAHGPEATPMADTEVAAQEIAQLLGPLAILISSNAEGPEEYIEDEAIVSLQRDAWFNVAVHGFSLTSPLGKRYLNELRILAQHSKPLVSESRADQLESDVELNTVLRRGKSAEHIVEQKRRLQELLPACEVDIKSLGYPEVVFLNTVHLVEGLRASTGDCTKTLTYFLDPRLRNKEMGNCMVAIAEAGVRSYLKKTVSGGFQSFSAPYVAQQLAIFFTGCCHRVLQAQKVAIHCADIIIQQVPSALCQRASLFALLELLSMMWNSCLEKEIDEYGWSSTFTSTRENISIELSDNYSFRRNTLIQLQNRARVWVLSAMDIAPLDIKGLLQTYLSEYDDDGAYGHVSLGRSFALEMGSVIPSTDQRLGAIDRERELNINTASDFVAQYTNRQEYRYVEPMTDFNDDWIRFGNDSDPLMRRSKHYDRSVEDARRVLLDLEQRTLSRKHVSIAELRDALRRAAALLCRSPKDECAIAHHVVGIPFAAFNKQSIKLGISLWLSIIKENPRMESRILVEIAENFEKTVRRRLGLFDEHFHHPDPFFVKQEFAQSDRTAIMKRQQHAYNLIAPHFRLLQFLESHFSATRLGSPHVERVYHRLMHITLSAMSHTTNHPLTREAHFHVVLLGLRILQYSTGSNTSGQWRLKDRILSAALAWFKERPRWSFGGNRLQIKAEAQVLVDIHNALQNVTGIGLNTNGPRKSLHAKQELLLLLLASEHQRLMVWLFPLEQDRRLHLMPGHSGKAPTDAVLSGLLKTAWTEDPAIAVQLVFRFNSLRLATEVRFLVLNFPEKVLDQPDALEVLLGKSLPDDVSFQLKYLMYWAPVNPMTAITYFLPAYGNHPFIIQYAMRALESHSVDITFFYVPQVVQTLRYDVLGYVERYIIETAKFSQLFAHQIIWNMKANAFKDEDSLIPDPVKPTLDVVMASLENSFSPEDREFYEREFTFFNEVTGISGKLKPFIKKSKPEKKQKIEEELRSIKVEVGVYLPSNPDGVVVGIDRKSGKPLQSHAKAPYMATFRIRKEKTEIIPVVEDGNDEEKKEENYYEVWQSAIFKVGDDCRQDVLALQMISAFRGIFNDVGLDVYVFPYRVTATAPGCGVIDVLPNSISRDMLGREAVNGLYDYFVSKYGGEDSIRFQEARNNFVKSMAAYSIISYLLQFKDRHNGNIMIDDAGHILHIDFGFCFDIAPGGIKFERAPFKLTQEMVAVMGGSTDSQPYRWFEELCIKAFLAARQHCEHLAHIVIVMLDSGLPCFKPETVQHFRERFVLDKTEREAAEFMRFLIKKSYNSLSTGQYDRFQLLTNGIPY
ncbi:putative phosphatidylinositol 3-kinase 3 [Diplodia seriata]|uniref:1-phosphatidylinositol 4-kinase n=1 Tax=Diplodia seriata TaxID=420778 RepID=A0A0G2DS94_9PEZI|nr:putative phosphatidylinositol 3-kinase 3 [Diplodia seriata]